MKLHQIFFWLLLFFIPSQLGRHFWPSWAYVYGLRVDYLSPTIYLTDVLLFLTLLFWFFGQGKNCFRTLFRHKFFLLLVGFLSIGSFVSQNHGAAFFKLFKLLEFSALIFYIKRSRIRLEQISKPLFFALIYTFIIALWQFLKQSSVGGLFWFLGERSFGAQTPGIAKTVFFGRLLMRPYATLPHPNALAGFLMVTFLLIAPSVKKTSFFRFSFALVAITVGAALCLSRAVFFATSLVVAVLGKKKRFLCLMIALMLIFAFMLSGGFWQSESFWQRQKLAIISFDMALSNPIFGVGLNNFIGRIPSYWGNVSQVYFLQPVHNIYLLVLSEAGAVGFMLFLWLIFVLIRKSKEKQRNVLAALLIILLTGMFDHYWLTLQSTQLLFSLVIGLLL